MRVRLLKMMKTQNLYRSKLEFDEITMVDIAEPKTFSKCLSEKSDPRFFTKNMNRELSLDFLNTDPIIAFFQYFCHSVEPKTDKQQSHTKYKNIFHDEEGISSSFHLTASFLY